MAGMDRTDTELDKQLADADAEEECGDSGFLSGLVSDPEVREEALSQSLERVSIVEPPASAPALAASPALAPAPAPRPRDLPPWQLLFQQDEEGDTQLHIAAIRGCEDSIRTLVNVCPARELLNVANDYGQTAMHLAVLAGHHKVARMLVMKGAKIDCRDYTGATPLHVAAAAGDKSCLHAILAPLPAQKPHHNFSLLNQKNYNGETSIHVAALGGHTDLVHMLVYYGADVNAREGLGGHTALHIAAERGDETLAQYLLEKCASVVAGELSYAGRTARQLAARSPAAAAVFKRHPLQDDEDYFPSDDDEYDDDEDDEVSFESLSLFNKLREGIDSSIPVA